MTKYLGRVACIVGTTLLREIHRPRNVGGFEPRTQRWRRAHIAEMLVGRL